MTTHTFRTTSGTCTITPTHVICKRSDAQGSIGERLFTNPRRSTLIAYTFIAIACSLGAVGIFVLRALHGLSSGEMSDIPAMQIILPLIAVPFVVIVNRNRQNLVPPVIDRATINSVSVHRPEPGGTGSFTIHHTVKKRPTTYRIETAEGEWEHARDAMSAAGLLEKSGGETRGA